MTVIVHIIVSDFEQFKTAFDNAAAPRERMGITSTSVYQSQTNPNDVFIVSEYEQAEGAESYNISTVMTDIMKNSGAINQPDVWFLNKA